MKINTRQMLNILHVLAWIIFIGLCIDAMGFLVNMSAFLFVDTGFAKKLWQPADLTPLHAFNTTYFVELVSVITIVTFMKAVLFYLIVKILHQKKVSLSAPFNKELGTFLTAICFLSFLIGLFSICGINFADWVTKQGAPMPDFRSLKLGGGDVWIFMSVILLVISQIFKRGIEIQAENEYTV